MAGRRCCGGSSAGVGGVTEQAVQRVGAAGSEGGHRAPSRRVNAGAVQSHTADARSS